MASLGNAVVFWCFLGRVIQMHASCSHQTRWAPQTGVLSGIKIFCSVDALCRSLPNESFRCGGQWVHATCGEWVFIGIQWRLASPWSFNKNTANETLFAFPCNLGIPCLSSLRTHRFIGAIWRSKKNCCVGPLVCLLFKLSNASALRSVTQEVTLFWQCALQCSWLLPVMLARCDSGRQRIGTRMRIDKIAHFWGPTNNIFASNASQSNRELRSRVGHRGHAGAKR